MNGPAEEIQDDDALKEIACHYKVLGLNPAADKKRLIKTYKAAIRHWAPDKYSDDSVYWKKALEMTQKIDKAYENILAYMMHPGRQRYPYIAANSEGHAGPGTFGTKQQEEVLSSSGEKGPVLPRISLKAVKPFTAVPNVAFLVYVCLVLCVTVFSYEIFSVDLVPQILGQSLLYIFPPLLGYAAFNLINGEALRMKYVSVALTGAFLFLVFPFRAGQYERLLHKDEVALKTKAPEAPDKDWISNGNALRSAGKYKASVQAYSKALEINPGSSDAYFGRAVAYSKLARDREFISDLRDAARLGNVDAIKTLNSLDLRY